MLLNTHNHLHILSHHTHTTRGSTSPKIVIQCDACFKCVLSVGERWLFSFSRSQVQVRAKKHLCFFSLIYSLTPKLGWNNKPVICIYAELCAFSMNFIVYAEWENNFFFWASNSKLFITYVYEQETWIILLANKHFRTATWNRVLVMGIFFFGPLTYFPYSHQR